MRRMDIAVAGAGFAGLASAAGKHITGQILAVDGGVSSCHGG